MIATADSTIWLAWLLAPEAFLRCQRYLGGQKGNSIILNDYNFYSLILKLRLKGGQLCDKLSWVVEAAL